MTILTLYGVMPSKTQELGTLDLDHIDRADVNGIVDTMKRLLGKKPEVNTFFRTETDDDSGMKWDLGLRFTEEFLSTASESQIALNYWACASAFLKLGRRIKENTP